MRKLTLKDAEILRRAADIVQDRHGEGNGTYKDLLRMVKEIEEADKDRAWPPRIGDSVRHIESGTVQKVYETDENRFWFEPDHWAKCHGYVRGGWGSFHDKEYWVIVERGSSL